MLLTNSSISQAAITRMIILLREINVKKDHDQTNNVENSHYFQIVTTSDLDVKEFVYSLPAKEMTTNILSMATIAKVHITSF